MSEVKIEDLTTKLNINLNEVREKQHLIKVIIKIRKGNKISQAKAPPKLPLTNCCTC